MDNHLLAEVVEREEVCSQQLCLLAMNHHMPQKKSISITTLTYFQCYTCYCWLWQKSLVPSTFRIEDDKKLHRKSGQEYLPGTDAEVAEGAPCAAFVGEGPKSLWEMFDTVTSTNAQSLFIHCKISTILFTAEVRQFAHQDSISFHRRHL